MHHRHQTPVQNLMAMDSRRPESARLLPTSNVNPIQIRRSRSAKSKSEPQQDVMDVSIEEGEQEEDQHQVGCPWRKSRSKSKNRLRSDLKESSSGLLHPRPWGARNPKDIPCHCKGQKNLNMKTTSARHSRSPTRFQNLMSRQEKQASRTKVADIIGAFVVVLERKKLKLNDFEFNMLLEQLKEKLGKFKSVDIERKTQVQQEQPQKYQTRQQQPGAQPMQQLAKSPVRKSRMAQSLTPAQSQPVRPTSRENLADQPRLPAGSPLTIGKLETNKYLLEVSSDDQVPQELKHILGMMSSQRNQDKLVLMENGKYAYLPSTDYPVLNAGVFHHQAQNTTLLLGSNVRVPGRPKSSPLALTEQHHVPPVGRQRRS